jgi:exportin-T
MIEISAEVADNMLKSARNASRPRLQRDSRLRDALREKDAPQVSEAVLAIITEGEERLASVRREGVARPAALEDIVGLGMRTFASIVRKYSPHPRQYFTIIDTTFR